MERYAYGTYGELLRSSEKRIRFLYNGSYGVATDENGLYYMRARYYNSDIKRFINQDIKVGDIGNSQSLKRYAYCEGNPVSFVDPFGLCPQNSESEAGRFQTAHAVLDGVGLFFDGADAVNAVLYAIEGDWVNMGLSLLSLVPAAGSLIAGVGKNARNIWKARKAEKILSTATDGSRTIRKAADAADAISDTLKASSKWGNSPLKLVDGITAETATKSVVLQIKFRSILQIIWNRFLCCCVNVIRLFGVYSALCFI